MCSGFKVSSLGAQALALFLRHHFGTPPPPPSELQLPGGAGATAGGIIMANREVMMPASQHGTRGETGLLCGARSRFSCFGSMRWHLAAVDQDHDWLPEYKQASMHVMQLMWNKASTHAYGGERNHKVGAVHCADTYTLSFVQVEEYSVLYISRHVFEHIRPGHLTGWQVSFLFSVTAVSA
jgi:hypothetical protein